MIQESYLRLSQKKAVRRVRQKINDVHLIDSPSAHVFALWPQGTQEEKAVKTLRFRRLEDGKQEHKIAFAEVGCVDALRHQPDVDISLHIFKRWRQLDQLKFLTCAALDFDVAHDTQDKEIDIQRIEQSIQQTLDACSRIESEQGLMLDAPNLIVRTGRGFHLYWLFNSLLPAAAVSRWARAQEYLVRRIVEEGGAQADVNAIDATRVLRLVGTVNSKAETEGQNWVVKAEVHNNKRVDFEDFARAVLPLTRAEIAQWRAKKQAKAAKAAAAQLAADNAQVSFAIQKQIERAANQYGWLVTQIREKWDGVVPKTARCRNTILFAAATCLAWLVKPEDLQANVQSFARAHIEAMSDAEVVKSRVSTVIARAKAAKQLQEPQHPFDDPRYVFSSKKGGWLDRNVASIFESASAKAGLYSINATKPKRHEYSKTGIRTSNVNAAINAHDLRAKGATLRDIAAQLSVSAKTVKKWLDIKLEQLYEQQNKNVIAFPSPALPVSLANQAQAADDHERLSFSTTQQEQEQASAAEALRLLPKSSINGFRPSFLAVLQRPLEGGGAGGESEPVNNSKQLNEIPVIEGLTAVIEHLFVKEDIDYKPRNAASKRFFLSANGSATVVQLIVTKNLWFNPVTRVGGAGLLNAAEQLFDQDRKKTIAKLIAAKLLPDRRSSTTKNKSTSMNT